MRIARLDEMTINQIAAGEVVENAASVLKELMENSLDAGATQMQIDLLAGGRQLLRVADNGCGMTEQELLACLERHATSKLRVVEDLDTLLSFGFRGEAIPSIGAISRMKISSAVEAPHREPSGKERLGEEGWGEEQSGDVQLGAFVQVEGGKVHQRGVVSRERGTTVEVRDLFFNVPARLKFQKAPSADLSACLRVVKQLALAHPHVRIVLRQGQECLLDLMPTDDSISGCQRRAQQVMGRDWDRVRGLDCEEGPVSLRLLLLPPLLHRSNRNDQLVFLNRRVVQCVSIGMAVRETMAHRLDQGRFPAFLASMSLPADWLDVNVHPQKKEVRLRHEAVMRGLVARATRCLLEVWDQEGAERARGGSPEEPHQQNQPASAPLWGVRGSFSSGCDRVLSPSGIAPRADVWRSWQEKTSQRIDQEPVQPSDSRCASQSDARGKEGIPETSWINQIPAQTGSTGWAESAPPQDSPGAADRRLIPEQPVIPLHQLGHLALVQGSDYGFWRAEDPGIWLVDCAALKRAYLWTALQAERDVQTQLLLLPHSLAVDAEDLQAQQLTLQGFSWTAHEGGILLTEIPCFLELEQACQILEAVAQEGMNLQRFLARCSPLRLKGISCSCLLTLQTRRQSEVTALGEPFRIWMTENALGQYLAQHALSFSSSTPAESLR